MIVKGATGEANGFTLAADAGADPGLTAFSYGSGGGMTLGQAATDAKFTIDGVAFSRATNIVDDVVPGMSLALKKAAPGQPVDIGASRPLDMIKQPAGDFVSVYNQMKSSLSAAATLSGPPMALRHPQSTLDSGRPSFGARV